ncbi:MAG TPA: GC-type dockerin domain-anchored protein [Phycisphaerales bacterium]|nr:GC-type dockerin domain-anchored protein [Phycisphaerales bacterium]
MVRNRGRGSGWAGLLVMLSGALAAGALAAPGEVAILDESVSGGIASVEAQACVLAGRIPVIIPAATWATMTTADFADYDAIVIGDPTCGGIHPVVAATTCTWGPAVTGNVILIGTDPTFHYAQGGQQLVDCGVAFAVDQAGLTGAYITLSCAYGVPSSVPVPELDGLCSPCTAPCFEVTGELGCFNDAHLVATNPVLASCGLTDATLSNWSCSVHEAFQVWPSGFIPLAMAVVPGGPYTAPDGTEGYPYIMARGDIDPIDDCDRDTIRLNSGFEHDGLGGGAPYPIGVLDAYYRVLYDPDPGTSEPRPAATILKHPAWANPDPDTQWLGAYTTSQALLNGYYVFEVCFCLQEGFRDVEITLGARADDVLHVFLNETLNDVITNVATPIHTGDGFSDPTLTFITFSDQSRLRVGENCLLFRVENTGSVAMGLDSVVTVSAPGSLAVDPTCCSNGSTLSGQKWNDLNGDGLWGDGEPALAGWTINLSDGSSTTTDSNGYYYFNDLDAGTYTVTETQQSGWVQTYPAEGAGHTVDLGENEAVEGYNFGNIFSPCGLIDEVSAACIPGPEGWTGCWDVTFSFINMTDVTVHYVLIADPNIEQHVIPLDTPVPPGGTSEPVTVTLCGVDGADCYPLHVALTDEFLEECCAHDMCVELPDCSCLLFEDVEITGPTGDFLNYTLSFQVTNMTPDMVEHMFIVAEPAGSFTLSPDYFDLPTLPPGATSGTVSVALGNLVPGEEYSIRASIHIEDLTECCSKVLRFIAPDGGGDPCLADFNGDGAVDTRDVLAFLNAWTGRDGTADCDGNGVIDSRDVICFLNVWNAGC